CLVPRLRLEGEYPLGRWVHTQRSARDKLSPDRRSRLDELGFVWDARRSLTVRRQII
ncbi:MAG: hypothetical protein EXR08_02460, partial [Alphaproteobacteria bacterium]|nr:hypothetical protein [Alphaproteobacteria bacterium]